MATVTLPPVADSVRPDAGRVTNRRAATTAVILALVCLPWLFVHANMLWLKPHYQFFPIIILGAIVLIIRGWRESRPTGPGTSRWVAVPVALALLLLAVAAVVYSPWLGSIGTLFLLAALVYGLGGWSLVRRMAPAWVFLWLAIPPPLNLDASLVARLQTWTARWSGQVLDLLGVFHVMAGNVVEVGSRRFEVEGACSGIHSLFAMLTCTVFFVLWYRRAWWRAAILLAVSVVWILAANVARVVGVTYVTSELGFDISTGWKHELFGFLLFAVSLLIVWSTDRLLLFVATPKVRRSTASTAESGAGRFRLPDLNSTWLASIKVAALLSIILIVQWGLIATDRSPEYQDPKIKSLSQRFEVIGESMLPATVGSWRRLVFDTETRSREHSMGHYSRFFRYRGERADLTASVDYPFTGWHPLTACYKSQGWQLLETNVLPHVGEKDTGDVVEAIMIKGDLHGYLLFQIHDEWDRPLPTQDRVNARLAGRLRSRAARNNWLLERLQGENLPTEVPTYQTQVFLEGFFAPTDAEREQAQAFFSQFRTAVRTVTTQPRE